MIKKTFVWLLVTFFLTTVSLAEAQQPARIPRIGFVSNRVSPTPATPDLFVDAFWQGLRKLDYVEGKNVLVDRRYSEGKDDLIPSFVAELIQLKVDVIVSGTIRGIRAAKQATKTIPIVMITTVDPVAAGLVDSLAHPGGNITGLTRLTRELSGKRLELLKEVVPRISRVGVLWNPSGLTTDTSFTSYEAAARAFKVQLQSIELQAPNPNFESAFRSATKGRVNAIIAGSGAVTISYRKTIAELALKNRMPSMCERSDFVEAGCLMSYSADEAESYRRAAIYVDKILKGRTPADLPVEQPMKFELVFNLKTANQIGITIPQWPLMKADRVIR